MEARPPALIETIVGILTPPACREYVLGDLCERYTSPVGYVVEAIRTIPLVIAGRIRRTCDALLVLGEAQILLLPPRNRSSAAGIAGINAAFEAALRVAVRDIAWVAGCVCLTTAAIDIAVPHLLPPLRVLRAMAVVLAGIFRRGAARLQEEIDAMDPRP